MDGKQRLTAILKFVNNEISYKGEYYKDQSDSFRRQFVNIVLPCYESHLIKDEEVVELYNRLNFGGTPHEKKWKAKVPKKDKKS